MKSVVTWPNVPSQESPLAFGMTPAREAESAGAMPKVPKGRRFAGLARWTFYRSPSVVEVMKEIRIT